MKNPRVVFVLVLDFIAAMNLIFMDPILVLRLEELGVNEDNAGLGFALMAGTFTVGSAISGILADKFDKRVIICSSLFLASVALWFAGGLYLDSEALTWTGLGLNGLFVAGIIIPVIPEVIGSTEAWVLEEKLKKQISHSNPSMISQITVGNIQQMDLKKSSSDQQQTM